MSDSEDYEEDSGCELVSDAGEEESSSSDKDYGLAEEGLPVSKRPAFRVLKGETLEERRKQALEEVTGVLGVTDEDAARLLRRFKWDVSRVHEEWFSNYDGTRASVGLQDEAPKPDTSEATCMICFESYPLDKMYAASCQHPFCHDCWRGLTMTAISDGPACLDLRCPIPKCNACVPTAIIMRTATPEALAKYQSFCVRSFVEDNRKLVWCVGRGCECAVECLVDRTADEPLDVFCNVCGAAFCFNCKEEAHRPVTCDWVRKWVAKNSAESENVHWIIANTKPCPRCCRPIEKNQGCMHMTCSQCRFEFCWLCQGDWKEHGDRTGGFFSCNKYDAAKRKGDYDEESRKRDNAKQSLERYMHYFERWDAHQKARNVAKRDQERLSTEKLERLSEQTKTPSSQLKFIVDAWSQIIECRRVLSWTYTYGYYALEDMDQRKAASGGKANSSAEENKREFFEFLQADAERSLERLHEAAESQLKKLMESNSNAQGQGAPADIEAFMAFRTSLIGLTDVTRGYFEKLVGQLEKGFDHLEQDYGGGNAEEAALAEAQQAEEAARAAEAADIAKAMAASKASASNAPSSSQQGSQDRSSADGRGGGSSSSKAGQSNNVSNSGAAGTSTSGRGGGTGGTGGGGSSRSGTSGSGAIMAAVSNTLRRSKRTRGGARDNNGQPQGEAGGGPEAMDTDTPEGAPVFWSCPHCTFNNEEQDATECSMCGQQRSTASNR